jgi:3-hydroxyisobutyrate dehydrogenase-like beta-hydroxyacid dehydrogenase
METLPVKLAFLGFGGAGYGLTKGLKEAGLGPIYFYDRNWDQSPYGDVIKKRAAETGAILVKTAGELVKVSNFIISCVTGAVALPVARSVAPFLTPEHLYADVNTASPKVKEEVAGVIEKTGAAFVDVAMMGAIPAFLHRVPMLVSGKGAHRFKTALEPYGMNITEIGERPGQASAIKMLRSIFMKGLVALLLETLNATHRYQVDQTVLDSLAETLDTNTFLETVRLQMTKGVVNAKRMAHEMGDVLETLRDLGVPSTMTQATQDKLEWCSGLGLQEYFKGEIPETLDEVLEALEKVTNKHGP